MILSGQNLNKVYFTPHPDSAGGYSVASRQTIRDTIKFSSEIGFETVILGRRENISIPVFCRKIFKYSKKADLILAIYPYICRPIKGHLLRSFKSRLIEKVNMDNFSILYIIDLPIEQHLASASKKKMDKKSYETEKRIFTSFDALLVFNKNMKNTIQEKYDISNEKIIEFEILDYGKEYDPKEKTLSKPVKIILSGLINPLQSSWIQNLPERDDIIFLFSGPNMGWINNFDIKNVIYKGLIPSEKFFDFLSEHHFGLIYKEFKGINYYEYTSTSKFSAYMISGLPVLCPSKFTYISHLVKKYGVGFPFDSFDEIPKIIDNLSELEYIKMRNNCINLGIKIKTGYFFKNAINKVLDSS